jgi:uncharacterized protein YndB with AHSA1/START domain
MARYAVIDEATIEAPPSVVWDALHAEFRHETDWWMPYWEARVRGEAQPGNVGTEYEVRVHPPGRHRQLLLSPRFVSRVTESDEPRHLAVEFPEGDFSGTGVWALAPVGGDKTHLRFDWEVTTRGPRSTLVGLFINIGAVHSTVMQRGFKGLNAHLLAYS